MKKILIISTIIILTSLNVQSAPSLSIGCLLTQQCFLTDPDVKNTYLLTLIKDTLTTDNGWTQGATKWTRPNGGGTVTGPDNASNYLVTWQNQVNSPQKTVRVTIPFTKGSQTVTLTDVQVVTVKFISPITALIFTGGNVSQTNPADNGTINIPCNAGNITLDANQTTPKTDPSAAITYSWTLPSGNQTSSTNVITFNASGTTDGVIKVSAKRNDGSFVTEFTVNFTRNRVTTPVIAGGSSLLCEGSNQLFGATSTNATTFSWAVTSGTVGLVAQSGSLASFTGNGNGTGVFTVTADNACNSPQSQSRQVATGTPVFLSTLVNGNPSSGFNTINNPAQLNVVVSNSDPSTGFNWTKSNGNGSIYPNYGGSNVSFNGVSYGYTGTCTAYASNFVVVKAEAANTCGVGQSYFYYLQLQGTMFRMASPNPTQSIISVELSKETPREMLKSITVVSDQQATVTRSYNEGGSSDKFSKRLDNIVNFDVSNLPRGKYFVVLVFAGEKKYTEQVVLN